MSRSLVILALTLCVLISFTSAQDYGCRWATAFTQDDLLYDETARETFIDLVCMWERNFTNIAYNHITGMTYDGTAINYTTGEPMLELRHDFSAASKEALHYGLLAKAIAGEPRAQMIFPFDEAISILEAKMTTLENWNAMYPGFGGFLPWYNATFNDTISLLDGWTDQVPALDNGEMIWGIYACYHILNDIGYTSLGGRFEKYFYKLAANAKMVFWQEDAGAITDVARIFNISAEPTPDNYGPAGAGFLNDPYEGELFAFFLDLFGTLNNTEKDQLWQGKMPQLVAVNWTNGNTAITVQQGFWFSAHENWKLAELPYLDVPVARRVFSNCERARTLNSQVNQFSGMFASVNDVSNGSETIPDYSSACGIQQIASQQVLRTDIITPYGAFPTMLINQTVALLWYHNMLIGPRMQGILGSTEAVNRNGTEISPVVTWDSKITTVLGMLGGIGNYTREFLKRDKQYARFIKLVDYMYREKFGDKKLPGEEVEFGIPNTQTPTSILGDFTLCTSPQPPKQQRPQPIHK